ncbi:hypothetical protein PLICRDRAFT_45046 [Plicaturopsis crispa FD-325 SS-3]|nr:hypothetical protein PLICRDRAFT_45046 [Plicaturopsis crispa FD-325 SS-3]
MSNDIQKADQIAYRFYTKLVLVLNNARTTTETSLRSAKVDKWFNIETPDADLFREHLRIYRSVSSSPPPPPLELQVLLTVPELSNNQALVYLAPDSSRLRVQPTPRCIVLETWRLSFTAHGHAHDQVAPPTIYKNGIPFFRSLFTLLRILPAWKLFKRLRRRTNANFAIQLAVRGAQDADRVLELDSPPAPSAAPLPTETHVFQSVPHPMGALALSATYLTSPNFQLDELESLLSSRFLSLDVGPEFTPTLAKNQQRDSVSGSPGSLPIRTSLPQSPPSSVVDRFILPPATTRTVSMPPQVGPSGRSVAAPMTRQPSHAHSGSVSSSRQDSSSAWSKDDGRPASGIAARLRKESTGSARGADLPSSPGPQQIRRPNLNVVHPFKSSTLSSSPSLHSPSPSLRQPSPLSSIPPRPAQGSPNSSRVPPSPMRPSPPTSVPFAPSSLGDRRSITSAEDEPKMPPRKRYSSSFGHRYANSGGAASQGSDGSGERRESDRIGSASFLSTNTDDDDISAFVQDIDARKPLSLARDPSVERQGQSHDRDRTLGRTSSEQRTGGVADAGGTASRREGSGSTGPMLTNESEIDERLRQMKETFLASLDGLGDGPRRERRPSSRGAASGRDSLPLPSPSVSDAGIGQGSDEVMGRMSFDSVRSRRAPLPRD